MTGDIRTARVAGPAAPLPRCSDCGARMPTDAKFCPSCGAAFGFASERPRDIKVSVGFGSGLKFGFGFPIGAAVVGFIAWLIGVVVFTSMLAAFLSGLGGTAATVMADPHRFAGSGQATSEPIRLAGTVDVEWTADIATSGQACWHRAAVNREDRAINSEIVVDQQVTQGTSGTYTLRGLPDARYLIEVETTCSWSFRLLPRT
jgi:hypothetical protein